MSLWADDRGQSIQVGAVLLFAVLIVAFSSYQAFVVPQQNREVEFSHNQRVHEQMQELRNHIVSLVGGGTTRATTIELGTRYPARLVALNPGPPSGTIRTVDTTDPDANVSIANAVATGETGDVWNGTARNYTTGGIVYDPAYNLYNSAPLTVYDQTALFNQFSSGTLPLANQTFVDGTDISLVVLNGSLSRTSSGSTSVDARPVSASEQTIGVSGTASDPINVTVPTRLANGTWTQLLRPEYDQNGGNIDRQYYEPVPGEEYALLTIRMVPGDYRLQLTEVGVGTGVTEEPATYITDVAGNGTEIDPGDRTQLTLQVRDAYNNPVPGVQVNLSASAGTIVGGTTPTTDGSGEVTVTYDSTGVSGQWVDVNASIAVTPGANFDASTGPNASMQVRVRSQSSPSGGGGVYETNWLAPPYAGITSGAIDAMASGSLPALMRATDGSSGVAAAEVDYAVNDSTVAQFDPSTGRTNATGYNGTDLRFIEEGYLRAYATTDATGARVNLTLNRLLNESFEDPAGTLLSNGWYYNDTTGSGDAGVQSLGGNAPAGSRVAYIDGTSDGATAGDRAIELNYTLNTSGYDAVVVTFAVREPDSTDDPDMPSGAWSPGENLRLQYRSSAGGWVTADNVSSVADSGLPTTYYRRAIISVANASHENFAVRFVQRETTNYDRWQIDSVNVTGVAVESRVTPLNGDPLAQFRYDQSGQTVQFYGNRSDDPDGYVSSYAWDFGDGTTGTGVSPNHPYSAAGTYQVSLTVTDEDGDSNTTTQSIVVSAPSGSFQSVGAVDMIPATSGQNQSFTFTPDTEIPANTQVTINLDDPQQVSPRLVDYQGSAGTSVGTISTVNVASDTASITWSTGSSPVSAGTTVRVWIGGVKTGPQSQQTGPYDVTFTRGDSGSSATASFEVGAPTGAPELTNLQVEDLAPNTNGQEQTILLEPTTAVPAGEYVSISLYNPQSSGDIDYGGTTLSTNVTTPELTFVDATADNRSVRLRAPSGGFAAGQVIAVNISGVDTGTMNGAPYAVNLSRGDADTAQATFGADTNNPNAIQFNNFQGFSAAWDTDRFTLTQIQIQDADGDDDLDRIEYEVTNASGDVVASFTDTIPSYASDQYDAGSPPDLEINDTLVERGQTYTLTATAYDADGNFVSQSLTDSTPSGSSATVYPTAFNDIDYSGLETGESGAIPPAPSDNGNLQNFGNIQADDGATTMIEDGGGTVNVGIALEGITTTADDYRIEMEYSSNNAGGLDAVLVDSSGTELQRVSLNNPSTTEQLAFTTNDAAEQAIADSGTVYLVFEATGADYTSYDFDYVRATALTDGNARVGGPSPTSVTQIQSGNCNNGMGGGYCISWSGSDPDGDFTEVTTIIEDSSGADLSTVTSTFGQTGSQSGEHRHQGIGGGTPSQVRVIARDAAGNVYEFTKPLP